MFAVIFVVQPKAGLTERYLDIAKVLRPELEGIDGFIDNERFASRRDQGRILSLSTWRDEKSVIRWRTLAIHCKAQERGRFEVFAHYHLQVGEVASDTHVPAGHALREQRFDETETGAAKAATLTEVWPPDDGGPAEEPGPPDADGLVEREAFESITHPGKLLLRACWRDAAGGALRTPDGTGRGKLRHRRVRIIRDYGLTDRREAPQHYAAVDQGPRP